MSSADASSWPCEAYGQELMDLGYKCFTGEDKGRKRRCASPEECSRVVQASRQQIYRRINELAASGDEAGRYLEGEFTSPDQLFSGGDRPQGGGQPAG